MQLSQSVTYALQSLLQLADSGKGVLITRGKLAAQGRMPERFLLEVLHDLVKRGILRSTRGGGGGFALARRPEDITLLDVIEAVDGPFPVGLPAGNSLPEPLGDWLRMNLQQVTDGIRAGLAGITLQHLMAAGPRRTAQSPASITAAIESEHG
jgi:Rrf2 family protein